MSRVLVAMSGGVDSAVAAALLLDQGHDVTGVHLKLANVPVEEQVEGQGCCTLDDAQDARRTAQVLDIPFYVWDLSDVFAAEVQDPFADGYRRGVTPNPCVACNEKVKYAALLQRARGLEFDALATGHHVRLRRGGVAGDGADVGALQVVTTPGSGTRMFRAADSAKDQSYVLHVATQAQLDASLFPVGELTKSEVRALAIQRGLRVADKPDSYDICFIPDGDTAGYLAKHLPVIEGDIVDLDGRVVGRHDGVWRFTIGQRRNLGLGHHERRFVIDIDAPRNRVVIGPREALAARWLDIADPTWLTDGPPSGQVIVQIRAHSGAVPATVEDLDAAPSGGQSRGSARVRVHLDEAVHGLAVGQSAVVYDAIGQECLGGGRIRAAQRPATNVASRHEWVVESPFVPT